MCCLCFKNQPDGCEDSDYIGLISLENYKNLILLKWLSLFGNCQYQPGARFQPYQNDKDMGMIVSCFQ